MSAKEIKKQQKKDGVTAQTTHKEQAEIDKQKAYKKRKSPNLGKMKSKMIAPRTYVFAKTKKLLESTESLIPEHQRV